MKKYTIKDFKRFTFEGRDPKETNLAGKVDEIMYGGEEKELSDEVLFISFPPKH